MSGVQKGPYSVLSPKEGGNTKTIPCHERKQGQVRKTKRRIQKKKAKKEDVREREKRKKKQWHFLKEVFHIFCPNFED